ncbi:unnamed protein product [Paramecium primaurelia]|uniref:Uncharacterized protein n=1 Tax=Paramecium primaurelia TaxID=5886 RepID=A0A8S1KI25_PARPR|nr:unnamed protein product [Paramecium primaurelia]
MTIQFGFLLSCFNIPQTDRLIITTRSQCISIRRETDQSNKIRMAIYYQEKKIFEFFLTETKHILINFLDERKYIQLKKIMLFQKRRKIKHQKKKKKIDSFKQKLKRKKWSDKIEQQIRDFEYAIQNFNQTLTALIVIRFSKNNVTIPMMNQIKLLVVKYYFIIVSQFIRKSKLIKYGMGNIIILGAILVKKTVQLIKLQEGMFSQVFINNINQNQCKSLKHIIKNLIIIFL